MNNHLSNLVLSKGITYATEHDLNVGLIELQCADDIIAEWAFCNIYGDCLFTACIDLQDDADNFRIMVPIDPDEREWREVHTEQLAVAS